MPAFFRVFGRFSSSGSGTPGSPYGAPRSSRPEMESRCVALFLPLLSSVPFFFPGDGDARHSVPKARNSSVPKRNAADKEGTAGKRPLEREAESAFLTQSVCFAVTRAKTRIVCGKTQKRKGVSCAFSSDGYFRISRRKQPDFYDSPKTVPCGPALTCDGLVTSARRADRKAP